MGLFDDGAGVVMAGAGQGAHAQGEQGGQAVAAPSWVSGVVVDGGQIAHLVQGGFACGGEWLRGWS